MKKKEERYEERQIKKEKQEIKRDTKIERSGIRESKKDRDRHKRER